MHSICNEYHTQRVHPVNEKKGMHNFFDTISSYILSLTSIKCISIFVLSYNCSSKYFARLCAKISHRISPMKKKILQYCNYFWWRKYWLSLAIKRRYNLYVSDTSIQNNNKRKIYMSKRLTKQTQGF